MANKIVREIIHAKGIDIGIYTKDFENEYISLTDIAKYRNDNDPRFVIQNWMRNRNTVEFLAVWEELHNPDFNRVQFEAVRNAADVLATLQVMQDFGVNLICVEDGIDSSKDAGKLMISVLSAVAEIERENIRVQTMEGRMQKAREGKWNGGFAPYGYSLIDGKLEVNEEEAVAIRMIFDQYVNTDLSIGRLRKTITC